MDNTIVSRRNHNLRFNATFSPASIYSTLTFDNEHEVHTFEEAKKIRDTYFKSLRRHYPEAVIWIYIGQGRSTSRVHFHMVSDGIPEEDIRRLWGYGFLITKHLGEFNYYDGAGHGADYTALANYLYDHWTPEIGGHRWKATRNSRKPEIGGGGCERDKDPGIQAERETDGQEGNINSGSVRMEGGE